MRITTLVNNTVRDRGLLAEHGLSFLVETGSVRVLFDTGQGKVLLHNAKELRIRLDRLDGVVLSHGHYDHTGALDAVVGETPNATVYLHPVALCKKYVRRTKAVDHVGIPSQGERAVRSRGTRLVWTSDPMEIAPEVHVTGEIPRRMSYEDTGGSFYLDEACTQVDPLKDDQALFVGSAQGPVVLLGCAHAGVVNTLEYVSRLTGCDKLHAVLGGMHLQRASEQRLERTAEAFERYQVRLIGPAHCTGGRAEAYLRARFPTRFVECATGSRFSFEAWPIRWRARVD